MTEVRSGVLWLLLGWSSGCLIGIGLRVFHPVGHHSYSVPYSMSAVALIGWLAYFGSRA